MMCHDGQAAKDFYTGLFGWTYGDHPAGPDMVYTMFSHNGLAACASAEAGPGPGPGKSAGPLERVCNGE